MTEDQIERVAEARQDRLDREYMKRQEIKDCVDEYLKTVMDSDTYEQECQKIKDWVDAEYRKISLASFRKEA